ncbi:MAG: CmcJ/NvfI family oxidoreductase [Pseudomonadota bacterium]
MTSTYCEADINYLSAVGPQGMRMPINNARQATERWAWAEHGFELQTLPSAVSDWSSLAAIEACHYDELTTGAKAQSGCDAVLFYPVVMRNPTSAQAKPDFAPIQFAHSDYCENYGDMLADVDHPYIELLAPSLARAEIERAEIARARRILTLQVWRNTGPRWMSHPLCLADMSTVAREQMVAVRVATYGGLTTEFDSLALTPQGAEGNRWYTFPAMNIDEVLVFRAYDSNAVAQSQPFWAPHTAFLDPFHLDTPRCSVEMRAICLFW